MVELRECGVATFDFSSKIHLMERQETGIHWRSTDEGKNAMCDYIKIVHAYLFSSMPVRPLTLDTRIDKAIASKGTKTGEQVWSWKVEIDPKARTRSVAQSSKNAATVASAS